MTKRIFHSILLVASTVLLLSLLAVTGVFYSHFSKAQKERLEAVVILAMHGVELNGIAYFDEYTPEEFRFTWVAADGSILYDSMATPEEMDNHVSREEINEAFESGTGESSRYSDTLMEKTLYCAKRLSDGTVIRASSGLASVVSMLFRLAIPIATVLLLAVVLSALLARRMAKRIVNPLRHLDFDRPMENEVYEELSPTLGTMNKQNKRIAEQMVLLRQKADEFEQIIAAVNEGIVLLDEYGVVISMNPAAKQWFGIYTKCAGLDFFALNQGSKLSQTVRKALEGEKNGFRVQKDGREFQFDVSPIRSEEKLLGVVLYSFDVTEQVVAERSRREFSANVSHELKTPLQSIMGSAELMENGLVKPEDMPRFLGNIRREAGRLVTLINDIIHLSELDEAAEVVKETVVPESVAREVFSVLYPVAEQKGITLSLEGTPVEIEGVRRYLYEILYNLCDNAIRYNKEGGSVKVIIGRKGEQTVIKVCDTGIGIPKEHQSRVFERFYRVDKSHSKETGGTGLGLSIVKHAVQRHGGTLSLESIPGEGTTITVVLQELTAEQK